MATVKPGWKTTEFWLATAAVAIGGALALNIVPANSIYEKLAALAMTVLASWGYTSSRSAAKKGGTK
jgi:hypothetical protein